MSRKVSKTNSECEQIVIQWIIEHPLCTVEEIAEGISFERQNVNRVLNGRPDLKLPIGLVNSGAVVAIAGVNENGRLVWLYKIIEIEV